MFKNTANQVIGAQMVQASDGAAFTGTVSCSITKDGGTQGAAAGTVTHEGNGFHTLAATQADTNGDHLAFTFTGTGAIPATIQVYTTSADVNTRLTRSASAIAYGTVGSGTNNTTTVSISGGSGAISPASTATNQFKARVILFAQDTTTTNLRGQGAPIDSSSTTAITIAAGNALTNAPQNGDTFVIV